MVSLYSISDGADRDVDAAFEAMLEADYSEDQMGELEGEAFDLTAGQFHNIFNFFPIIFRFVNKCMLRNGAK